MGLSEIVQAGFSLGYAEQGSLPLSPRSRRVCEALVSLVEERGDEAAPETLTEFVMEAGRDEGIRSKRYGAHSRLYSVHQDSLRKAYAGILKKVPTAKTVKTLVDTASAAHTAGASAQERRALVAGIAGPAIREQITPEERANLDTINAAGWAHATAYGQAEGKATPVDGGPPDWPKVAAFAAAAYAAIGSAGSDVGSVMTDQQIDTLAYAIAVQTGDGQAVDISTAEAKTALMDTEPAVRAYSDQLHGSLIGAYVEQTSSLYPDTTYNYVNGGPDPCDTCLLNAVNGPYAVEDLPDYPQHPNCLCDVEVASPLALAA